MSANALVRREGLSYARFWSLVARARPCCAGVAPLLHPGSGGRAVSRGFLVEEDWLDSVYEALSVNDIDLFLSAFSPKARWHILGHRSGLPFSGIKVGHSEIRDLIRMIHVDFKMQDFFIEDIIVNQHSGAVRWSALSTSVATGEQAQIEVFDHIVFEGRQIMSLTQFFDTASVAASAGMIRTVTPGSTGR